RQRRQVDVRFAGDPGRARVDAQQRRRIRPGAAVEDPRPQHALRLRDVVAVRGDDVGVVEVGVGARLAVTAEAFLQRLARGRRAQPGVAVQVWGADAATGYRRERVVLLEEQLAAGVERERGRAVRIEQF